MATKMMQKTLPKTAPKPVPKTVLIPILSKRENAPDFLIQSTESYDFVVLLSVLDRDESVGSFGFAANEIRLANHLMEQIAQFLSVQGKQVEQILEWGTVASKISQTAGFYNCQKIVLVRQENEYYHKLVTDLRVLSRIEIEEVIVPVSGASASGG
ncbi:MAG: hypothetical protein Q7R47_06620 [Candidatus Diapherotrites archaeon]|nr:hypothetical protein [Candidatus Diapherotrites archaeon]